MIKKRSSTSFDDGEADTNGDLDEIQGLNDGLEIEDNDQEENFVGYPRADRSSIPIPFPRIGKREEEAPSPVMFQQRSPEDAGAPMVSSSPRLARSHATTVNEYDGYDNSDYHSGFNGWLLSRIGRSSSSADPPTEPKAVRNSPNMIPMARLGKRSPNTASMIPMARIGRGGSSMIPMARMGRGGSSMIPMARIGRDGASMIPMARMGRGGASMIPMARIGRDGASMIPMARIGRSEASMIPMARIGRAGASMIPMARIGRSKASMIPMARLGKRNSPEATMIPMARMGRDPSSLSMIPAARVGRAASSSPLMIPMARVGRSASSSTTPNLNLEQLLFQVAEEAMQRAGEGERANMREVIKLMRRIGKRSDSMIPMARLGKRSTSQDISNRNVRSDQGQQRFQIPMARLGRDADPSRLMGDHSSPASDLMGDGDTDSGLVVTTKDVLDSYMEKLSRLWK